MGGKGKGRGKGRGSSAFTRSLDIPPQAVGLILGPGGQNIKKLQAELGCTVFASTTKDHVQHLLLL